MLQARHLEQPLSLLPRARGSVANLAAKTSHLLKKTRPYHRRSAGGARFVEAKKPGRYGCLFAVHNCHFTNSMPNSYW